LVLFGEAQVCREEGVGGEGVALAVEKSRRPSAEDGEKCPLTKESGTIKGGILKKPDGGGEPASLSHGLGLPRGGVSSWAFFGKGGVGTGLLLRERARQLGMLVEATGACRAMLLGGKRDGGRKSESRGRKGERKLRAGCGGGSQQQQRGRNQHHAVRSKRKKLNRRRGAPPGRGRQHHAERTTPKEQVI